MPTPNLVGTALLGLVLIGCTVTPAPSVDPAAVPSSSLVARGEEPATGPIVELGSGTTQGIGWRYSIYESVSGWCRQLETASATHVGCGDPLPADGAAFGGIGSSDGGPVEGLVSEDVATVWLVDGRSNFRVPAEMLPLEDAGLPGSGFIGFAPEDLQVSHLQAVALSGEILETYELP
ncbi:MAG TPA: hypothetical protein VFP30_00750 [Candidatus Limnocylindria bacterium]|nr:hypothetical protein [Candidatus Limnocylindria bacterium]